MNPKKPKDLKLKFGSKQQQVWDAIATNMEQEYEQSKAQVEINQLVLEHAKKRLAEETAKFEESVK